MRENSDKAEGGGEADREWKDKVEVLTGRLGGVSSFLHFFFLSPHPAQSCGETQ